MLEFKINDYITLKLKENKTILYVGGKEFMQCKRLVLMIPSERIHLFDEIKSIDEVIDNIDEFVDIHSKEFSFSPRTEFWAHCSNLQVFVENNYDTNLLHSEMSFWLLRKLSELGDPIANRKIKFELIKRFESNYTPVIYSLIEYGFLGSFTKGERKVLLSKALEAVKKTFKYIHLEKNFSYIHNLSFYLLD